MATPTCAIGLVQPYMYEPSEPESGSEEEEDSGRPVDGLCMSTSFSIYSVTVYMGGVMKVGTPVRHGAPSITPPIKT